MLTEWVTLEFVIWSTLSKKVLVRSFESVASALTGIKAVQMKYDYAHRISYRLV